jgi:hypothetical protein
MYPGKAQRGSCWLFVSARSASLAAIGRATKTEHARAIMETSKKGSANQEKCEFHEHRPTLAKKTGTSGRAKLFNRCLEVPVTKKTAFLFHSTLDIISSEETSHRLNVHDPQN